MVIVFSANISYRRRVFKILPCRYFGSSATLSGSASLIDILRSDRDAYKRRLKDVESILEDFKLDSAPDVYVRSKAYMESERYRDFIAQYSRFYSEYHELVQTIKSIERALSLHQVRLELHSESLEGYQTSGPVDDIKRHENRVDIGGEEPLNVKASNAVAPRLIRSTVLGIEEFFSRPVDIYSASVSVGSNLDATVNVWNLYFNEPSVRAKLRNVSHIRGDLCVKIAITATPFHYGKVLAAYVPFPAYNIFANRYATAGATHRLEMLQYYSQVNGSVIIDVNSNQPVDMECPYISPQPMISLFNNSTTVLAAASSFDNTTNMGTLYIRSLDTVKSVNSVSTPISIYLYAWMENVQLGCPTGTQLEITSESLIVAETDERVVGPVERVSTVVAQWMGKLSVIPEIAPFARASEMIASGVAGFASLFGWSYPVMNTQPNRVKNEPFQNEANVIGYDTGKRITLDPKQELTVDPSVVAVSTDELAISSLASKMSLMSQFTWSPSDPVNVALWRAVVNPRSFQCNVQAVRTYYQPTALAFTAAPFRFWRGKIKYRMEVVASKFHRGKFAVFFEPNIAQSTLISANFSLNKQFVTIVDIQETQCIEFEIDWAQERYWKEVIPTSLISTSVATTGTFGGTNFSVYANGFISFVPINPVRTPDGSSIQVNVFVSSDDIIYNQPEYNNLPQSIIWSESLESVCPAGMTSVEVDPVNTNDSLATTLHFGEVPVSFRSLLKRFAPYTLGYGLLDSAGGSGGPRLIYPTIPTLTPNLANNDSTPTLFNYIRSAFLGMRGGLRKRSWVTGIADCYDRSVFVSLDSPSGSQLSNVSYSTTTNASVIPQNILRGLVTYKPHTNAGIEFEIPFYTSNLFAFACNLDPFPVGETTMNANAIRNTMEFWECPRGITSGYWNNLYATGEDFTFLRFISSPSFSVAN